MGTGMCIQAMRVLVSRKACVKLKSTDLHLGPAPELQWRHYTPCFHCQIPEIRNYNIVHFMWKHSGKIQMCDKLKEKLVALLCCGGILLARFKATCPLKPGLHWRTREIWSSHYRSHCMIQYVDAAKVFILYDISWCSCTPQAHCMNNCQSWVRVTSVWKCWQAHSTQMMGMIMVGLVSSRMTPTPTHRADASHGAVVA